MTFPFGYLLSRVAYRVFMFFYNWYVASFFAFSHFFTGIFEWLDQTWALKVTAQNLLRPLYQDRTIIGFILGFIFRSFRLVIGGILYGVVFVMSVCLYLGFASIPFLIVWYGFYLR